MYPSRPRTDGDVISSAPRVALRSTLGYLIMPRWGERSGYGSVLIAQCRRSKVCWVIRDGACRWFYAPTGRKGIAQGKAKRRPGIRYATKVASPERAERTHRETNARCTHRGRVPTAMSYPAHPGWRFALPWAISLSPVGARRSGYVLVLIAQCRRSKLWWVIRDGVCPMALCPNGAQGDSPG
jgi:hypothetical protein